MWRMSLISHQRDSVRIIEQQEATQSVFDDRVWCDDDGDGNVLALYRVKKVKSRSPKNVRTAEKNALVRIVGNKLRKMSGLS
jgi:hypothetical protein